MADATTIGVLGGILGIAGFFIFLWLFIIALGIATTVFWIFMLVDAVKRDYDKEDEKVVWILVIALTGLLGAAVYYFAVKKGQDS